MRMVDGAQHLNLALEAEPSCRPVLRGGGECVVAESFHSEAHAAHRIHSAVPAGEARLGVSVVGVNDRPSERLQCDAHLLDEDERENKG